MVSTHLVCQIYLKIFTVDKLNFFQNIKSDLFMVISLNYVVFCFLKIWIVFVELLFNNLLFV